MTCVDKDENAIYNIKKKFPNIKAVKSDILNFDYQKDKYELVLILNVLHFFNFQQAKQIIDNTIISLKKGGLIYLQVFSTNDPAFKKTNKNLLTEEKNTFFKKDNHPPQGEHEHYLIKMLVRK